MKDTSQNTKMNKRGIDLIAEERAEHFEKHHFSIKEDVRYNTNQQLAEAALLLLVTDMPEGVMHTPPKGWNKGCWAHMCGKSYSERLIIAGSLIAAEYDRINH